MPDDCFCMKLSVTWIFEFYLTVFEYIYLCSLHWALWFSYRPSLYTIFISTNSSPLQNGPGFPLTKKDIFSTQGKEFLSVLEELQNANVFNSINSTTRHPTACTPEENTVSSKHKLLLDIQVWCSKWVAFRRVFLFRQTQSLT